jgi:DNA polymerase III delta prime subunit
VKIAVNRTAKALLDLQCLPTCKAKTLPDVLVGLETQKSRLLQLLTEDGNRRSVLLYGMAASGKTTLAKAVFNELHERNRTMPCHFVQLMPEMDSKALLPEQVALLEQLACEHVAKLMDDDEACRLIADKLRGLKVLLVVDNVSSNQLKWLLPGNIMEVLGEGSMVLFTSRDRSVVKRMRSTQPGDEGASGAGWVEVEMECLTAQQSTELFCRHVTGRCTLPSGEDEQWGGQGLVNEACLTLFADNSPDAVGKLQGLVARCGGLPMALELAGKHLAGLGHSARQEFFEDLEESLRSVYHGEGLFARLQPSWEALSSVNKEVLLDIVWFLQGRCWGLMACYCNPMVLKELQKLGLVRTHATHGACKSEQQAVTVHPVLADFCKMHTQEGAQRRWAWSLCDDEDERRASEYLKQISVRPYVFIIALHWHGPPVSACGDSRLLSWWLCRAAVVVQLAYAALCACRPTTRWGCRCGASRWTNPSAARSRSA